MLSLKKGIVIGCFLTIETIRTGMKILKLLLILGFSLSLSCSKKLEKPKITLDEYNIQSKTSKGVVEKILNESDYKKMHEIALAIESSRSINCISVSEECNVLGQILNKIVNSTQNSLPKEEDNVAIYKLANRLDEELRKGQKELAIQWKEYLNAHSSE